MAKFDLTKALTKGVINLFTLEGTDAYALVLDIQGTDGYIIPLLKDESGALAYISDSYTIAEYSKIQEIINTVFLNGVYKAMYTYNPIRAKVPTFDKTVISYIKPTGGVQGKRANDILIKNGFNIDALLSSAVITTKRDYSELLSTDKKANELFVVDKTMVEAIDAKYDTLSPEIKIAYEGILSGKSNGIIFMGPTGTGKSFACRVLAVSTPAPLMNIQITYGTTVEDLVGMYVPNDDPSIDAKFKFVPGPLLIAYTKGYQVVIEEVNFGQPGIISKLNEFTDFTPRVVVNGVIYKKHPNFVCYMTMNPGYEGTEVLNVALKNRFAKVDVPALTSDEFCKRAMAYSKMLGHQLSYEFFTKLFNFANFIEKEGSSSRWHENIKFSIRNAQRLCDVILQKKCSFTDFSAAVAVQYLNDLSCDNDNSEKLQSFKSSADVVNEIQALYDLYDFSEVTVIDVDVTLDDLFIEEPTSEDPVSTKAKSKMVDDLFSKF